MRKHIKNIFKKKFSTRKHCRSRFADLRCVQIRTVFEMRRFMIHMLSTQCQLNKFYTQQLYIFQGVLLPDKIYDWKIYVYITMNLYIICRWVCWLKSILNLHMQHSEHISIFSWICKCTTYNELATYRSRNFEVMWLIQNKF